MKRLHLFLPVIITVLLMPAHAQQGASQKWDVAAALGPTTEVTFDTSEGTWMNVDVSPDGRRIVFDLLGDIYTMPVEGSGSGAATRITSGAMFDMQPRFSPDGRRIAFTSDRDGLWNIWTIDVEGKNAVQISKERRWFVNSPTWAPDGSYIFARFVALMPGGQVTPGAMAAVTDPALRAAGMSRQKIAYFRDLTARVLSGELGLDTLDAMTDDEVIAALTKVKGIGRWSAEMFLMFRLHRPDVLPVDDLGIVNAVKRVYGLRKRPTADRIRKIGEAWKPYRSVASWYLWRSLDNEP